MCDAFFSLSFKVILLSPLVSLLSLLPLQDLMTVPQLALFLGSKEFENCRQNAPLNEAVRSYPTILNAFCQEEEKTFAARDDKDKKRMRELITAYLDRRCKEEQNFKYP